MEELVDTMTIYQILVTFQKRFWQFLFNSWTFPQTFPMPREVETLLLATFGRKHKV